MPINDLKKEVFVMSNRVVSIVLVLILMVMVSTYTFAESYEVQDIDFIQNTTARDRGILLDNTFLFNKLVGKKVAGMNTERAEIENTELSFAFKKNEVCIKSKIKFSDAVYEVNLSGIPYFDEYLGKEDQKIMLDLSGGTDICILLMNVYNGKNPVEFMDFKIPSESKPIYYFLAENSKTGENKFIYGYIDETIFRQLIKTAKHNTLKSNSSESELYPKIYNFWVKSKNTVEEYKNRASSNSGKISSAYFIDAYASSDNDAYYSTPDLSSSYSYNNKLEWIRLIEDLGAAGYNGVNPDNYNLPSYILKADSLNGAYEKWYHINSYNNYSLAAFVIDMASAYEINLCLMDVDAYFGNWIDDQIDYNFSFGLNNNLNGNLRCVYDENTNRLIKISNSGLYYKNVKAGVGKVNNNESNPYDTNCINQARVLIIARTSANDNSTVYNIWNNIKPLAGYVPYGKYASTVFSYLIQAPGTVSNSYNIYSYGPDYLYQKNNYNQIHINQVGDTGSYVLSKVGDKVRVEVDIDTYYSYTLIGYWQYSYTVYCW
jgi:hypothetical protein